MTPAELKKLKNRVKKLEDRDCCGIPWATCLTTWILSIFLIYLLEVTNHNAEVANDLSNDFRRHTIFDDHVADSHDHDHGP